MLYTIAASPVTPQQIAEPRRRYRRRARGFASPSYTNAPTERIELRVRSRRRGARWQQILKLHDRFSERLPPRARETWLALEEALHDYWLEVAEEHYRVGVEVGLTHATHATSMRRNARPEQIRDRLRVLVVALAQLLREVDEPERSP